MSNYSENVEILLARLKAELGEARAKVKALAGDGVPFWRQLHAWGQLATSVVVQIFDAAKEVSGISRDDKLNAAIEFLVGLVNIPFIPKFMERKFVQFGIHIIWGVVKKFVEDQPVDEVKEVRDVS
jgi:hypothetical protein